MIEEYVCRLLAHTACLAKTTTRIEKVGRGLEAGAKSPISLRPEWRQFLWLTPVRAVSTAAF
jgi:hypothetical protein